MLVVITEMRIGGASITALETAQALRDDFEFVFACGRPTTSDPIYDQTRAEFELHRVDALVPPVSPRRDVRAARDARKLIRDVSPALVHTHSSKAGVIARFAARGSGVRVVHSVHGWGHTPIDNPVRRRALIGAERIAARWCDALIAVSEDVRDAGIELGIGRPEQYTVIPGFVDFTPSFPAPHEARAQARHALGIGEGVDVIGWVGRFEPQKSPGVLAEVLIALLSRDPARRAVLIGDGTLAADVSGRLASAGLRDRAVTMGSRVDVRRLYAAFDVLVHTSLWEGHPRVPQEAIAERVPVVMARTAGTREILRVPGVGIAVEPRDVDGFVAAVETILGNRDLRAPLRNELVEAVASENGRRVSLVRQRALYESLLA